MTESKSPFGDSYQIPAVATDENIESFARKGSEQGRQVVVVQGLGFVGAAMAAALAQATDDSGKFRYQVLGIDLEDQRNYWKIGRVNSGLSPVKSADTNLDRAFSEAHQRGNLLATGDPKAYGLADVVVVDLPLDVGKSEPGAVDDYRFSYERFVTAIRTIGQNCRPDALIIVETTVPPGTTEKVVRPLLKQYIETRGLDTDNLAVAHSYERVMPGASYLASITDFYRVFAGSDTQSSKRARDFLEGFINTDEFPLSELSTTTASEMSKVLENSFRAMNIAFIQEWTEFADRSGVNLFEVIQAIRMRPTHKNIMAPGFGVGGYCLTKDPLLADWANKEHFGADDSLKMSLEAVRTNDLMPEYTLGLLEGALGSVSGKTVGVLGVSYLQDVADTRSTPAALFTDRLVTNSATVVAHDPIVTSWPERSIPVLNTWDDLASKQLDAAVFTVRHKDYLELSAGDILERMPKVKVVVDACNVLGDEVAEELSAKGIKMIGVGKGHWNR